MSECKCQEAYAALYNERKVAEGEYFKTLGHGTLPPEPSLNITCERLCEAARKELERYLQLLTQVTYSLPPESCQWHPQHIQLFCEHRFHSLFTPNLKVAEASGAKVFGQRIVVADGGISG